MSDSAFRQRGLLTGKLKSRRALVKVGGALEGVAGAKGGGLVPGAREELHADGHAALAEAGDGADGGKAEVVAGAGEAGDAREELGGGLAGADVGLLDGGGREGD